VNLLIGALTIGFILAPLSLGVFLSYRIYRMLDLTADGSFGVGAAVVAALLVRGVPPLTATGLGFLAGFAVGSLTGGLHTQFQINTSLAGMLISTGVYSVILFVMGGGNLSLARAETLDTLAERLGQRIFQLPASVTLLGTTVSGGSLTSLLLMALLAGAMALALAFLLRTDLGLGMRAAGNNPQMARAVGIEVDRMVVLGLGLSNGLIALSGALFAQHQGFANIEFGVGALVSGLATVMIGESLLGKRSLGRWIAGAVVGAVAYRLLAAAAIVAGLNPDALKLVTAILVLSAIIIPELVRRARARRLATRSLRHA
jgi:putative tryptophan/tyrosine transport system permease protein